MTLFNNMAKSSQVSQNLMCEGNLSGKVVLNLTGLSNFVSNDNQDLIGILKLLLDKQTAMNAGMIVMNSYQN